MGALIYFDGTDYDNPIGWGKLHMTNNFMNSKPSPINQAKWLGIRHQQLIAFCSGGLPYILHQSIYSWQNLMALQMRFLTFQELMTLMVLFRLVGGLEHGFYDFPYIGNDHPN